MKNCFKAVSFKFMVYNLGNMLIRSESEMRRLMSVSCLCVKYSTGVRKCAAQLSIKTGSRGNSWLYANRTVKHSHLFYKLQQNDSPEGGKLKLTQT